ncbi:MAG: ankyrin repeat domain-containing protein [bacterium]|nr:ankyrin repeat domain-containing protein [bacterium]
MQSPGLEVRFSHWKRSAALALFALLTASPAAQPIDSGNDNETIPGRITPASPPGESQDAKSFELADANEQLFTAVINGDPIGVRVALARGAQINARDLRSPGGGESPLMHAALAGDPRVVRLLLHRGARVNARDDKGDSALLTAIALDHSAIVHLLLEAGADVNAAEHRGFTPLHIAADRGNLPLLRLLLKKNGARSSAARNGFTPLMLAAKHRPAAAALLLANGARVNARTRSGTTALMVAATSGQLETLRLLLRSGADAKIKRRDGSSALTFAIQPRYSGSASGNIVPMTRLLLRRGADPDELGSGWWNDLPATPLMRIARDYSGYGGDGPVLVRLLLEFGADPAVADAFDRRAYDFAMDSYAGFYPPRRPPPELLAALHVPAAEGARADSEKLRDLLRSHTEQSEDLRRKEFEQLLRKGRASPARLLREVCDIVFDSHSVREERDALVAGVFRRLLKLTSTQKLEFDSAFLMRHCRIHLPVRTFPEIYEAAIDNGFDVLSFNFRRGRWPNHGRVLRRYLKIHSPALPANRARLIELYAQLVRSGSIEGVRAVLAGGIDPGSVDAAGLGALDYAVRSLSRNYNSLPEEREILGLLEEQGALLLDPGAAMCRTIAGGNNAVYAYLKTRVRSSDLRCIQGNGQALLYALTLENRTEALALARAAGLEDPGADLLAAIRAGDRAAARRLLAAGAPVYYPTLLAAFDRFPNLAASPFLERLLHRLRRAPGAARPAWADGDPSWRETQSGWSEAPVLIRAIEALEANAANTNRDSRAIAAIRALLRRGLYPDIVGRDFETFSALQAALSLRSSKLPLRLLLEAGANPNARRPAAFAKYDRRPMEYAAISNMPDDLRLLLAYGGRSSIADRNGRTLLMRAAENALVEQACMLRRAGADPNARRTDGLRAIDMIPESQKWVSEDLNPNRLYRFRELSAEQFLRLRACLTPGKRP